jgi:hypothetical protein
MYNESISFYSVYCNSNLLKQKTIWIITFPKNSVLSCRCSNVFFNRIFCFLLYLRHNLTFKDFISLQLCRRCIWDRLRHLYNVFSLWAQEIDNANLTKVDMEVKVRTYVICFPCLLKCTWVIVENDYFYNLFIGYHVFAHLGFEELNQRSYPCDVQRTQFFKMC